MDKREDKGNCAEDEEEEQRSKETQLFKVKQGGHTDYLEYDFYLIKETNK